jgi:sulfide:quinone oxidoreductase
MPHRIVIIGGGTGGTLAANRLHKLYGDDAEIVLIDRDDRHVYQPGLLFVPFAPADPHGLVRSRAAQLRPGVRFRIADVDRIDPAEQLVHLRHGETLRYDVLVIAAGAELLPDETDGLKGAGWGQQIFTFYDLDGAARLRDALRTFERGRLVVNPVDMPIKCPVAPLEFCFLADWFLRKRGVRDAVELTYVTPLDGAFTKPVASEHLAGLLTAKDIAIEPEFATGEVDGARGRLVSWDEREVPFDLLVTIPLHGGPRFVARTPGLGDDLGFVLADRHTLQAELSPNIFAIGDATNLPTSKAGSVAHFEAATLVENVRRRLAGQELARTFDGHVNCFVETGFHKALLIDFDYEREPLPGHFGPLPLLKESRLNHVGKQLFQWVYWHALLPGHDIPGGAR